MTVLIKVDQHKMTHWLAPQPWHGRISVPAEVALPCLESLPCTCTWLSLAFEDCTCSCIKGTRLSEIGYEPSRHTELGLAWRELRRTLLAAAREYVHRMAQQSLSFQLVTPENRMLVYGPYRPIVGARGKGGRVLGENPHPHLLDFKIWGEFSQKYARVTDEGPGRPEWALKYWAEVDRQMEVDRQQQIEAEREALRSGKVYAKTVSADEPVLYVTR